MTFAHWNIITQGGGGLDRVLRGSKEKIGLVDKIGGLDDAIMQRKQPLYEIKITITQKLSRI
jgi:hypothetical protein